MTGGDWTVVFGTSTEIILGDCNPEIRNADKVESTVKWMELASIDGGINGRGGVGEDIHIKSILIKWHIKAMDSGQRNYFSNYLGLYYYYYCWSTSADIGTNFGSGIKNWDQQNVLIRWLNSRTQTTKITELVGGGLAAKTFSKDTSLQQQQEVWGGGVGQGWKSKWINFIDIISQHERDKVDGRIRCVGVHKVTGESLW